MKNKLLAIVTLGMMLASCGGQIQRGKNKGVDSSDQTSPKSSLKFSLAVPADADLVATKKRTEMAVKQGAISVSCSMPMMDAVASAKLTDIVDPKYLLHTPQLVVELWSKPMMVYDNSPKLGLCSIPAPMPVLEANGMKLNDQIVSCGCGGCYEPEKILVDRVIFALGCPKEFISVEINDSVANGTYELTAELINNVDKVTYEGTTGDFQVINGSADRDLVLTMNKVHTGGIPVTVVFQDNDFPFPPECFQKGDFFSCPVPQPIPIPEPIPEPTPIPLPPAPCMDNGAGDSCYYPIDPPVCAYDSNCIANAKSK